MFNMKKLFQILLFTLLTIILSQTINAQSGINVYAGLSSATNRSEAITPEGFAHNGYHIGADARLNEGNMYFILGGQYHNLNFLSSTDSEFLSFDSKMSWIKLRVGLGFNVININDNIAITAKTLGGIDVISSVPTDLAAAPFDNYNTGTAGVSLGLGLDFYNFTFNVEYERGFFNAVNMVEGTEFDFFTLSVGFLF